MGNGHEGKQSRDLGARVRDELRRYALVSAYLFVCFSVVLLYRSAVLLEQGQHFLPFGTAAVKALVLGKFLLIGEAVRVGERLPPARTLVGRVVMRSMLLLLALVVMTLIEEVVVGWVHHRSAAASLGEFFGPLLPERLAGSLVMLLVLVPLVAPLELNRALGRDTLDRLLYGR